MTMTADVPGQVPWWKEPTKDQWVAWIAAWLGWTLLAAGALAILYGLWRAS